MASMLPVHTGEPDAFTLACEQLQAPLIAYVTGLVGGDRHTAEDIVQLAFLRLWQNQGRIDWSRVNAWLWLVAKRLVIDRSRKRENQVVAPAEEPDSIIYCNVVSLSSARMAANPADVYEGTERAELVNKALSQLPTTYRTTLALWLKRLSYDEMATVLGVPVGTVKSRLNYAKGSLKTLLADHQDMIS